MTVELPDTDKADMDACKLVEEPRATNEVPEPEPAEDRPASPEPDPVEVSDPEEDAKGKPPAAALAGRLCGEEGADAAEAVD